MFRIARARTLENRLVNRPEIPSGADDAPRIAVALLGFLALNLAGNLTYEALYQTRYVAPLHAALLMAQPYLLLYIGLSEMCRIKRHVGASWRRIAEALRLPRLRRSERSL